MKEFAILFIALIVTACHHSAIEPDLKPEVPSTAAEQVSRSNNDFAFNIFRNIQGTTTSQNISISPFSVSVALAMVLNGAQADTRQSILNVIDYGNLSGDEVNQAYEDISSDLLTADKNVQLNIANSIWYNNLYSINKKFDSVIVADFSGNIQALDFMNPSSKDVINNWVSQKTNNKINNLIDGVSPNDVMYLLNALYFNGSWSNQFNPRLTHTDRFTTYDGANQSVNMMQSDDITLLQNKLDNLQLIDIPYGNGQFRFTILLPENEDEYKKTLRDFNSQKLSEWLSNAESVVQSLHLPKFKITWKDDLKPILSSMGMSMQGFPYLLSTQMDTEISRITHQTIVDVDEVGTEAAAATGITVTITSVGPEAILVNKPFIFMIREKNSGVILFMGQLMDPSKL